MYGMHRYEHYVYSQGRVLLVDGWKICRAVNEPAKSPEERGMTEKIAKNEPPKRRKPGKLAFIFKMPVPKGATWTR